ncbi:MAG: 4Fe-4S binding protein, partial [Candidatus Hydrothermarchaeales archaeon]
PKIVKSRCDQCGECVEYCPTDAIEDFKIDQVKCARCNVCLDICERGAVKAESKNPKELAKQIALNASAVGKIFKDRLGCINLLTDIIPHCDCHPHSDIPFVPDMGILASKDPVAVDKGSIDLVNESPGIPLSAADDVDALKPGLDKFGLINPQTNWKTQIEMSEYLGLGSQKYSLKEIRT